MLLLLLLFLGTVSATTNYFVSLTGNDSADGSSHNSPFKSVAKCLSVASVDGTCFLNGGRYDLEMYPLSINQDITLAADPQSDNGRPILDGSQLVQTTWKQSSQQKCVYRSTALSGSPVSQLWSSGMSKPTSPPSPSAQLDDFSPLTPARFPNALLHDDSVFDGHPTNTNGSLLYSKRTSSSGNIYDSGTHIPSLESSGIDFTGMIAVLPLGTMGMLTQGVVKIILLLECCPWTLVPSRTTRIAPMGLTIWTTVCTRTDMMAFVAMPMGNSKITIWTWHGSRFDQRLRDPMNIASTCSEYLVFLLFLFHFLMSLMYHHCSHL